MKLKKSNRFGFGKRNSSKTLNNQIDLNEEDSNAEDDTEDGSVISIGNRIYFYSHICKESILALNKKIKRLSSELLFRAIETEMEPIPIFLHINSPGGSAVDGLLGMDYISNCKVPVFTVVDGECSSAATFLALVGDRRSIHKNSVMMIHQLSTMAYGTFANIEDEMQNCKLLMEKIVKIYQQRTKLSLKKIEEILKHDVYFSSDDCLKYGLVDKII